MDPNKVYRCKSCGELNPTNIDKTPDGLFHAQVYTYYPQSSEENIGAPEFDWAICGEIKLDVLETFKAMIKINK